VKTHFMIVMLACVALTCASGYADQKGGHAPASPQRSRRRVPAVGKPPQQLPKRQARVASAPPLSNVRHRSPNPAIIAGSAELGKRSTGAIDGKQVHRRP
jgi:hypothetical protein